MPGYLPDAIRLQDPSKMHDNEVEKILTFWRAKQVQNEVPFKFMAVQGKGGQMLSAQYPVGPPRTAAPKVFPPIRKTADKGVNETIASTKPKQRKKKKGKTGKKKVNNKRENSGNEESNEAGDAGGDAIIESSTGEAAGALKRKAATYQTVKATSTRFRNSKGLQTPSTTTPTQTPGGDADDTTPPANILPWGRKTRVQLSLEPSAQNDDDQTPTRVKRRTKKRMAVSPQLTAAPPPNSQQVTPRRPTRQIKAPLKDDVIVPYSERKPARKRK